jgi:nucleotide-binding universal stress UspA family protein
MYKTILVHLNDERRAQSLLAPALTIANRFSAHLIGLYVYPAMPATPPVIMPYGTSVLSGLVTAAKEEADRIRKIFDTACVGQQIVPEWRSVKASHADLAAVAMDHARAADLVVAGQTDPDWDLSPVLDFPERMALESGRPVLIVPRVGGYARIGERVMIAWNNKRESARATFDAMPLLSRAEMVKVLTIEGGKAGDGDKLPDTEIAASLARHGVNVTSQHSVAPETSVADEILNRVSDESIDLLVMGAYGHSRFRELVFGGVTRGITRHMTVPTLFSH